MYDMKPAMVAGYRDAVIGVTDTITRKYQIDQRHNWLIMSSLEMEEVIDVQGRRE